MLGSARSAAFFEKILPRKNKVPGGTVQQTALCNKPILQGGQHGWLDCMGDALGYGLHERMLGGHPYC